MLFYIIKDEYFNISFEAHKFTDHTGKILMPKDFYVKSKTYCTESFNVIINLEKQYQMKHSTSKKGIVLKPLVSTELYSLCPFGIINLHLQRDGKYTIKIKVSRSFN